jgi:hypothetical protein
MYQRDSGGKWTGCDESWVEVISFRDHFLMVELVSCMRDFHASIDRGFVSGSAHEVHLLL